MNSVLSRPTAEDSAAAPAWQALRRAMRDALWARQRGDTARADQLLREHVPGRVAAWSKADRRGAAEQRRVLAEMVEEETRRAAEVVALADVVTERLGVRLADQLAARLETLLGAARTPPADKPAPLRDDLLRLAADEVRILRGARPAAPPPVPPPAPAPAPAAPARPMRADRIPIDDIAAMIDFVSERGGVR